MKAHTLQEKHGLTFPLGFYIIGLFICVLSIVNLVSNGFAAGWKVSLGLFIPGLLLLTPRDGLLIRPQTKQIKLYFKLLGIPFGKWKSYEVYPHMVVLCKTRSTNYNHPRTGMHGFSVKEEVYELNIASANHIHQITIKEMRGEQAEVYQEALALADELGVELMRYNPGGRRQALKITEAHVAAM